MTLTPELLIPCGKILLTGSFAFCLVKSMRGEMDLSLTFARLCIGLVAILFFQMAASGVLTISHELADTLSNLGHSGDLKAIILDAFQKAAEEPPAQGATSFNLPAVLEQAWRTGVWGVLSTVVDWIFLVSDFLLQCARDTFWELLLFLFPISCGLYPVFPHLMTNLIGYAIELSLWLPMLQAIELITSRVAQNYMKMSGSLGLHLVAVELIAILLIISIPTVTHRFLSGAFSGDLGAQASVIQSAKRAMFFVKGKVIG